MASWWKRCHPSCDRERGFTRRASPGPSSLRFLFRRWTIRIFLRSIGVPVACRSTLAPRLAGFIDRPFVRVTLLVSGLAAFACDASLFFWIHRCESTSTFLHSASSGTSVRIVMQEQRQITPDVAGDEKVLANVLVALLAELLSQRGV